MARPVHKPTKEIQNKVLSLVSCGYSQKDIATVVEIDIKTLTKYYKKELETGLIKANVTIAAKLFEKAKAGDTASIIFWLKSRAGWSEKQLLEHSGPNGGAIAIENKPLSALFEKPRDDNTE